MSQRATINQTTRGHGVGKRKEGKGSREVEMEVEVEAEEIWTCEHTLRGKEKGS